MSSKVMKVFGALVVGAAFMTGATQGCGGGSGSGANIADLCNRSCTKTVECLPIPGLITVEECKAQCTSQAMGANGQRCTNESAIVAKANECLSKATCSDFIACGQTIPECQGASAGTAGTGGGAAGTTGTAGTGSTGAAGFQFDAGGFDLGGLVGTAGVGGSSCSTACTKADACCAAVAGSATNCAFKTSCDGAGANQTQAVQACNAFLNGTAALGASQPAACK